MHYWYWPFDHYYMSIWAIKIWVSPPLMSLWIMLSMGAPAVGGFVLGAVADRIGFGATLIGAVPLVLFLVGYLWRQARGVRLMA